MSMKALLHGCHYHSHMQKVRNDMELKVEIDKKFIDDAVQEAAKKIKQNYIEKDVLDKIRAEIDQKQYAFMDDKDYDEGIRFGLMLAYQIVDKYKESEE